MPGPNEYFNVPLSRVAIGNHDEFRQPGAVKAAVAEFISTLIFVFAGSGSGIAYNKLTGNGPSSPPGLIAASIAHAFGLFVAVAVGANISGGHVNPAVTFGLFVGGNITLFRGILYIIAQLLGSVVACLLLSFTTGGLKGEIGVVAPIAIGFIVGANILAGGAFTGASMNPAVSFGPALVSFTWTHHWVYWAGPLVGGGLAGIVYEVFFINHSHEPLSEF
ncbi:hypothetical protein DH2020_000290 [Rehmannia glutinosa]|uniref:Uncharacterized protein n=1 Tax=Rehmannia glutinosa TaxID=99300 RepID=A0ABR0XWI6_REHGL